LIDFPKLADEMIIKGSEATGSPKSSSGVNDYVTNVSIASLAHDWKTGVESSNDIVDRIVNAIAVSIVSTAYIGNTTAEEPQKAKQIVKKQIYRFIALFFSFIVIWNWWFLWNYTTFTFDFESMLKFPLLSICYYIFEPSFKVIETLNYYLLTMRMDATVNPGLRTFMRSLWDWRPIAFAAFILFIFGGCLTVPFGDIFVSLFTGNASGFSKIIIVLTVLTYLSLTLTSERIQMYLNLFFWFPPLIPFVILLVLLFVILFSGLSFSIFVFYLVVLSHFSLLLFTLSDFPFGPLNAIWRIYEDLGSAASSDDDDNPNVYVQIKKFLFQNAHNIAAFFVFFGMFVKHMTEIFALKNISAILLISLSVNAPFLAIPSIYIFYLIWNMIQPGKPENPSVTHTVNIPTFDTINLKNANSN
jgi:hypothetical protein